MGLKKQENIHIQGDNFKERNNYQINKCITPMVVDYFVHEVQRSFLH